MDENSIWWAANSLIRLHGPDAAAEAAMMADKLRARNDSEGHEMWRHITDAIHELEERTAQVRQSGR
jgi:hypothetical protein